MKPDIYLTYKTCSGERPYPIGHRISRIMKKA